MIVTCPQCATRYEVEADRLRSRAGPVRCAKCGHSWIQPGPAPHEEIAASEARVAAAAGGVSLAAPGQPRPSETPPAPETRPGFLMPTWIVLLLAAAVIAWSAMRSNSTVYPPLGRTAASPRTEAFAFAHVRYAEFPEHGRVLLWVRGSVRNPSSRDLTAPRIEAMLLDAAGQKVDSWQFAVQPRRLPAHGEGSFTTEHIGPPNGRQLMLAFAKTTG